MAPRTASGPKDSPSPRTAPVDSSRTQGQPPDREDGPPWTAPGHKDSPQPQGQPPAQGQPPWTVPGPKDSPQPEDGPVAGRGGNGWRRVGPPPCLCLLNAAAGARAAASHCRAVLGTPASPDATSRSQAFLSRGTTRSPDVPGHQEREETEETGTGPRRTWCFLQDRQPGRVRRDLGAGRGRPC
uniref:collagen alpha-1(I) chain-like isoform X2 n=1 Tax=Ictidomys tridecemlineatus TaxID=43179 RepID=UPI001A9DD1C1|nr:collagen alpha-1(I) chain-like isoform X2 [Ictidomys tridecemlineatus]